MPKTTTALTRKQKAFADYLLEHPKQSATKAIQATYGKKAPPSINTAAVIANENLNKPNIVSYLAKHSKRIEDIITSKTYELVESDDIRESSVGLLNARWIHDKIHGTATARTEVTSTKLQINIDLTGSEQ